MINFEGGAIADEYQVEYVMDRVEATSTAFMGLTMGCARCHAHKFDPISHKEFYQFFAFFNNVPEQGLDGRRGNAAPMILLTTPAQQKLLDDLDAQIEAREAALEDESVEPAQREWEQAAVSARPDDSSPQDDDVDRKGLTAHYELDGSFSDISGRYQHGRTVAGDPTFDVGSDRPRRRRSTATRRSASATSAHFDRADPFSLAVWMRPRGNLPIAVFQKLDDAQHRRGFEWRFDDFALYRHSDDGRRRLTITMTSDAPGKRHPDPHSRAAQVRRVESRRDGLRRFGQGRGLAIYVNGERLAVDVVQDALAGPIRTDAPLTLGAAARSDRRFVGQIDDLRLYNRVLTGGEIEDLALHYRPRAILSGVYGKRSKDQAEYIREYFLTHAAPDALRAAQSELEALREAESGAREADSDGHGDGGAQEAARDVRAGARRLSQPDREGAAGRAGDARRRCRSGAPLNRLTLAKWLVQPGHPLTSRVAVNRFWQMYFGHGIVKTQEDFGVQGEPPVHPELLDWLATEFVRTGWDIRAMQRLIVTSATYRQSSKVTRGAAREGSGKPTAGARSAVPDASGDDPRHGARRERSAQRRDRRSERAAVSAARACGRSWRSATVSRRRPTSRATARTCIAAGCTRSGSAPRRRPRLRPSTRRIARSAPAGAR